MNIPSLCTRLAGKGRAHAAEDVSGPLKEPVDPA
jgi:hypothetical protein